MVKSNDNAMAHLNGFTMMTEFKTQISFDQLSGEGVEFGALHNPLSVDLDKAHVLYADRLHREQALEIFPELDEVGDLFIEPDLIVDFNTDDLSSLANNEFNFYIANHFIEHLVNPIRLQMPAINTIEKAKESVSQVLYEANLHVDGLLGQNE